MAPLLFRAVTALGAALAYLVYALLLERKLGINAQQALLFAALWAGAYAVLWCEPKGGDPDG